MWGSIELFFKIFIIYDTSENIKTSLTVIISIQNTDFFCET